MNDYTVTSDFGKPVYLHEMIWVSMAGIPIPEGNRVCHLNGDVMDCRRGNLALQACKPGEEYMGDPETTLIAALGV